MHTTAENIRINGFLSCAYARWHKLTCNQGRRHGLYVAEGLRTIDDPWGWWRVLSILAVFEHTKDDVLHQHIYVYLLSKQVIEEKYENPTSSPKIVGTPADPSMGLARHPISPPPLTFSMPMLLYFSALSHFRGIQAQFRSEVGGVHSRMGPLCSIWRSQWFKNVFRTFQ